MVNGQEARPQLPPMQFMAYEYKTAVASVYEEKPGQLAAALNEESLQGWELLSATPCPAQVGSRVATAAGVGPQMVPGLYLIFRRLSPLSINRMPPPKE